MNESTLQKTFIDMGCLPHQAEFAAAFFAPEAPRKHLLIGAPGTGKGFVSAVIMNHALTSGVAHRVLVLAPAGLLSQWHEMIVRGNPAVPVIKVDRRRLREIEDSKPVGEEIWPSDIVILLSLSLARKTDVAATLGRCSWDLLVADEAQPESPLRRPRVVADLISRCSQMRSLLLQLTGIANSFPGEKSAEHASDIKVTYWTRETLRDHEGKPLLPEVNLEWITYHRQPDEAALLARLQELLQSVRKSGDTQSRFMAVTLLQSASSSLFALEQRLRRFLQRRNELAHGISGVVDAEPDGEGVETDESFAAAQAVQVRLQLEMAEIATPILQMLEDVTTDSKCEALLQTLHLLGVKEGAKRHACVFTRFVDTATYLASALRDRYSQVRVLTGSLEFVEREQIVADFTRNGGVLIAPDSMTTTIPEVAAVVFYDLPLNPAALEARIGQFVRVGRRGPIRVFAFTDESNALVIERLQRKIAEVKEIIGEQEIDRVLFSKEMT